MPAPSLQPTALPPKANLDVDLVERFKQRLDDPSRNWKISEADYSERELWPKYVDAYEDAMERTSTKRAPRYVIPSNHKWFRNLAVSQIIAEREIWSKRSLICAPARPPMSAPIRTAKNASAPRSRDLRKRPAIRLLPATGSMTQP